MLTWNTIQNIFNISIQTTYSHIKHWAIHKHHTSYIRCSNCKAISMDCKTRTCRVGMNSGFDSLNECNTIIDWKAFQKHPGSPPVGIMHTYMCLPINTNVNPLSNMGIRLGLTGSTYMAQNPACVCKYSQWHFIANKYEIHQPRKAS